MITVSHIYDDIIEGGGHYEWRVYNNGTTFGKEHIVSGTIQYEGWNKQLIGNVISAQLNLTLWNVTIDTDYPIYMQFRATDGTNNSPWYTNVGFYVDTMQTNPYTQMTEITAFDSMLKTETDYMPNGSFVPIAAKDLAEQIATDIGLIIPAGTKAWLNLHPYTFSVAPNVGVGGTTDKDMLSYIATIYGGNWIVRGNALDLIYPQYSPNDTANVGNAVSKLKRSETEVVKRVKLWLDHETYFLAPQAADEEAWLALGGRCIEAHLPFYASQAVADNLASEYGIGGSTRSFIPYTVDKAYIDPKYEVGDGVTFATDALSFTSRIASMTINIDPLAASRLEFEPEDTLNSLYPYISRVEREMLYEIAQTQTTVANANSREQIIYISAVSGTNTMAANTTWVTNATGNQNVWTTTRPVYDSSYPVLFVATQRQSVEQAGTTACSCTTPVKDQTTTVIDGGHITTGTIDAGVVNVTNINADNIVAGTISDASGQNYWDLANGNFVTKKGTIGGYLIGTTDLTSGSYGIGTAGTVISPSSLAYTSAYNNNGDTTMANINSSGVAFGSAHTGDANYTSAGYIRPSKPSGGLGVLSIGVDPLDGYAHIMLYDPDDTSQTPIVFSYNTRVNGNITANSVKGVYEVSSSYASVANLTALNNAILAKYADMDNGSVGYLRVSPSASISPFGVYVIFFTIYKNNGGYGAVEGISYQNAAGATKHSASIWNNTITGWV